MIVGLEQIITPKHIIVVRKALRTIVQKNNRHKIVST